MNIICYGDSNTFGYDPRSYFGGRYESHCRWVDILAVKTGWNVHNNGMNGRRIPSREVVFPKSTDLLVVMLGTNDLLQGNTVQMVLESMDCFLNCLNIDRNNILLVAPPPLQYGAWVSDQTLVDASVALGQVYQELAERQGIHFADSGRWNISISFDGVHFTEDGHKTFAEELKSFISHHII